VASWILSLLGYVPSAIQSAASTLGIKSVASAFAALVFCPGVACRFLHRIDTKTSIRMTRELAERRKEYAS
jgi:Na+/melibiose symporter-like transporter